MVVAQDCASGRIHEMSPFAYGADNCFVVMGVDRNIISGKALNLISGGRAAVDEKWHAMPLRWSRDSDPRMNGLLDRTCGERPMHQGSSALENRTRRGAGSIDPCQLPRG